MSRVVSNLIVLAFLVSAVPTRAQDAPAPKPAADAAKPGDKAKAEESRAADPDQDPKVRRDVSRFNLDDDQLALKGYDPVAYFEEGGGRAKKGDKKHAYTYRGATYRFASEENLARFKEHPSRYEPKYGGWCAWAMVDGDRVEVDPESFIVKDGQLFLFYNGFFGDTRSKWLKKDHATLASKADAAWKKMLAEKSSG